MLRARDRRFQVEAPAVGAWRDADPFGSVLYDSLSALFPQGERFFIDSVRRYRDHTDGPLAEDVRQFIAQEAIHTREHIAFNQQVNAAGYDMAPLEARTEREIARMRRRSSLVQLASTVGLEHFTAILAHQLLADPRHLGRAPAETQRLWRWHAAEEIEHKTVAFDTLAAATRSWSAPRRWAFRCAAFVEVMGRLIRVAAPNFLELRRQHGEASLPLAALPGFLLARPGMIGQMAPALFGYLAPGFHPWRHQDAALAEAALAE